MSLRNLVAVMTYPALVGGAVLGAWILCERGLWPELVVAGIMVVAATIIRVLERHFPFAPEWNRTRGDDGTDALHFLFSTVGVHALFQLGVIAALAHLPRPTPALWPHAWPLLLQLLLALLLAELGAYWAHRLMHQTRLLWRIHLVHHSARRLYSLNASRNHPLDMLVVLAAAAAPLLALGAGPTVFATLGAFAIVHLTLQHANVALRLGPLNWLFAGPELHRWHHSRKPEEASCNYGHLLAVWDLVFGTRLLPADRTPPCDIGLFDREGIPESYPRQLAAPFDALLFRDGDAR